VTGDKITFYRHDHAYPGSDTEVTGPYTWSVHRDRLTFKKTRSGEPTGQVVKPWRKAAASAGPAAVTPRHAARGRQ